MVCPRALTLTAVLREVKARSQEDRHLSRGGRLRDMGGESAGYILVVRRPRPYRRCRSLSNVRSITDSSLDSSWSVTAPANCISSRAQYGRSVKPGSQVRFSV